MRAAALLGVLMVLLIPAWSAASQPSPPLPQSRLVWIPIVVATPRPSVVPPGPLLEPPRATPSRQEIPAAPTPRMIVETTVPAVSGGHSISGRASWYCWSAYPSPCAKGFAEGGDFAAAGPGLRAAMCGDQASNCWRGRTVSVNGYPVRLIDWCQCHYRTSIEKLIDLYHSVWVKTGAKGGVTITW